MFPLNILKDLKLHYKGKYKIDLRNFFLSDFLVVTTRYLPMLEIWHLNYAEKKTKTLVF